MKKITIILLLIICLITACSCGNEHSGDPIGTEDVAVTTGGSPETNAPETDPPATTVPITTTAPISTTSPAPSTTVPVTTAPITVFEYFSKYCRTTIINRKEQTYNYYKVINSVSEFNEYLSYASTIFDLDDYKKEGPYVDSFSSFNEVIKNRDGTDKYNSEFFKSKSLIIAVVEAPAAILSYDKEYEPKLESVKKENGIVKVVITGDPLDGIRSTAYHFIIEINNSGDDLLYSNTEFEYRVSDKPKNGVVVSVDYDYEVGGEIRYDPEGIGRVPVPGQGVDVIYSKSQLDEMIKNRSFSAVVRNQWLGKTFLESVKKYDDDFFDKKMLIAVYTYVVEGYVPKITSVNKDEKTLRVGINREAGDYLKENTQSYPCIIFVEIQKESYDKKYEIDVGLDYTDQYITEYDYKIAPITEDAVGTRGHTIIIESFEQLDELPDIVTFDYNLKTDILPESFAEITSKYGKDYFDNNVLVLIRGEAPTGIKPQIDSIRQLNNMMIVDISPDITYNSGALAKGERYVYYLIIELSRDIYQDAFNQVYNVWGISIEG